MCHHNSRQNLTLTNSCSIGPSPLSTFSPTPLIIEGEVEVELEVAVSCRLNPACFRFSSAPFTKAEFTSDPIARNPNLSVALRCVVLRFDMLCFVL